MGDDKNIDEVKEILQRLVRLEVKVDMVIETKDTALVAERSAKSAHNRLDDMAEDVDKISGMDERLKAVEERSKGNSKVIAWVAGTFIGAIIVGAIGLLFTIAQQTK